MSCSDITIADLLQAKLLNAGDELVMSYKPRTNDTGRLSYTATVLSDGSLKVDDQIFSSSSYAAVYCIQKAGSSRKTVNGWIVWRTREGKLLAQLRDEVILTN